MQPLSRKVSKFNAMNIIIANPVITEHDAIGNDVLQQFLILTRHGYSVFLYAEKADVQHRSYLLTREKTEFMLREKRTVLIYHHGTLWEQGERLLNGAACKVLFKYHNITPASFFERYSKEYTIASMRGREQTVRFALNRHITHFLPDSLYNGQELVSQGVSKDKITTLPPFHLIETDPQSRVNSSLLKQMSDGMLNVLFVGRLAPNKGHSHLIEVIYAYTRFYDRKIHLNIVGGLDPRLEGYYRDLIARISYYELHDVISFKERVDPDDLMTYYKGSDVFLLMSEHEGFCVPILEAQYHRLPVIAFDCCAVKNTIGPNQVLISELDYELFAGSLRVVGKDRSVRRYLADQGMINYVKYDKSALSAQLLHILAQFS